MGGALVLAREVNACDSFVRLSHGEHVTLHAHSHRRRRAGSGSADMFREGMPNRWAYD